MSVNKEVIEKIRNNFVALDEENGSKFDTRDVERVKSNDWWIERFILTTKSEDSALKALVKCMEWRKSFGVNDFKDDYFPEEFYKIGYLLSYCKDREDRPVVWNRVKAYRKISDFSPLMKQFVIYSYEKADRQTSHEGWAIVSDSTGGGLANSDSDLSKFMTEVLQNYYPLGPKYMAVVELPWIMNATAKLIMVFMNSVGYTIKFIKKDELTQYIDPAYIPVHLKGTYDNDMITVPIDAKPLEQLTHTKFTSDQIKKFYSTYKTDLQ